MKKIRGHLAKKLNMAKLLPRRHAVLFGNALLQQIYYSKYF